MNSQSLIERSFSNQKQDDLTALPLAIWPGMSSTAPQWWLRLDLFIVCRKICIDHNWNVFTVRFCSQNRTHFKKNNSVYGCKNKRKGLTTKRHQQKQTEGQKEAALQN